MAINLVFTAGTAFSETGSRSGRIVVGIDAYAGEEEVQDMVSKARTNIEIIGFLQKAQKDISAERYERAEMYLQEALEIDPGNEKISALIQETTATIAAKEAVIA